ncbi:unnamed protein product [Cylicostephanus goldi]|uniref:Protein kinase domain-containing protein n=1 Tax=Cylicostephanus goldi TaxID=71465 RepID=A0A3P6RLF3_CYLGO|nr:unnamed protein product [Cylicostephanus goldi]
MKTEMTEGDKLMLRLKIEVQVFTLCNEIKNPKKCSHFLAFVDKGKTRKFKFLVMGLVGKSLEDIRRNILYKNYSKPTAMNASLQTLQSIWDLHDIGYLHRQSFFKMLPTVDIKPQNFAIGLGHEENIIYMLDFGIARKYRIGDTKQVKVARLSVKFLGTIRFASRACHLGVEQGRKDDLEAWLYMVRKHKTKIFALFLHNSDAVKVVQTNPSITFTHTLRCFCNSSKKHCGPKVQ